MHLVRMKTRGFFKLYQNLLTRRPFLVQAFQSGTLMATGDLISQTIIEHKSLKEIDTKRTLRFASIGFVVGGPVLRLWYGLLNKYVGSTGKTVAMKKVFIDQCLFAPTFLFLLLVALAAMQGKNTKSIKADLEHNYLDVLKTNFYIWPAVQLFNFYYVPLQYQVLLVQFVALFWNTYLSWKTNKITKISAHE